MTSARELLKEARDELAHALMCELDGPDRDQGQACIARIDAYLKESATQANAEQFDPT